MEATDAHRQELGRLLEDNKSEFHDNQVLNKILICIGLVMCDAVEEMKCQNKTLNSILVLLEKNYALSSMP